MKDVAPHFSSVLKSCSVSEGQDFVLQCSVDGSPMPQITWLLNGKAPFRSCQTHMKKTLATSGVLILC